MVRKKIAVGELVMDWNLWPRFEAKDLDATNIARIREAFRANIPLPPPVVDAGDYRIIDGFHRVEAFIKEYGLETKIEVSTHEYKDDNERFLDSVRLNNIHGLPLTPRDKVHVILRARRMKMPIPEVAKLLGMTDDKVKSLLSKRTATTQTGEKIPLSYGATAMAGKTLTAVEEHFVRTANGSLPWVHVRLLVNAMKADAMCKIMTLSQKELLSELIYLTTELVESVEVIGDEDDK